MNKGLIKKILLVLVVVVLCATLFALAACGDKDKNNTQPTEQGDNEGGNTQPAEQGGTEGGNTDPGKTEPTPAVPVVVNVALSCDATLRPDTNYYAIEEGQNVTLTVLVTATGTDDLGYTLSINSKGAAYAQIEGNVLSLKEVPQVDKIFTVTATSTADVNKSAALSFYYKAPVVSGEVGELTTEMFEALGDQSITVYATVTDIVKSVKTGATNSSRSYESVVKMQDGRWQGQWRAKVVGDNNNPWTSDLYVRGTEMVTVGGETDYPLQRMYIDKDNHVTTKNVTDYMSTPTLWRNQHLWNHLAQLGNDVANKFVYDAELEVYKFVLTELPDYYTEAEQEAYMEEQYLLTYFAYSLTAMMDETFASIYVTVADGKIVKIEAQTEVVYDAEDIEEATELGYSTVTFTFGDIGTTVVQDPAPYTIADDEATYFAKLTTALEAMRSASNFTMNVAEITTRAPALDADDYSYESAQGTVYAQDISGRNEQSASGQVGEVYRVTEDAILIAKTGEYSYYMDENDRYFTSYSGYKQTGENTYDYFEYVYTSKTGETVNALAGLHKYTGSVLDRLPKFDFAIELFEFGGSAKPNGVWQYTFNLRESSVAREIAMQISTHSDARSAEIAANVPLSIVVDDNGKIVSTTFPYNISSGMYVGYCVTTYKNIGTTTMPEGIFDNYVERVVPTTWAEFSVMYLDLIESCAAANKAAREANPDVGYDSVYKRNDSMEKALALFYSDQEVAALPDPALFFAIFGDYYNGPFADEYVKDFDAEGNRIYQGYVHLSFVSEQCDENMHITNYAELIEALDDAFAKAGWTKVLADCGTTANDKYVAYLSADGSIEIVIDNYSNTRFLDVYLYHAGDWSLATGLRSARSAD